MVDKAQNEIIKYNLFKEQIQKELVLASKPNDATKVILVVVHDQLEYIEKCISSVNSCTKNHSVLIFDNASNKPTKDYLYNCLVEGDVGLVVESKENLGFIKPNNNLMRYADSQYVILLNSDCEVKPGWDNLMINYLEENPDVGLVGYGGGILDNEGKGKYAAFGDDAQYVCGWCMAFRRELYDQIGLFDEDNLKFAYGEDSDFSFRVIEQGYKLHVFHATLVVHHENKTIHAVHHEMGNSLKESFEANHAYIRHRWAKYLGS